MKTNNAVLRMLLLFSLCFFPSWVGAQDRQLGPPLTEANVAGALYCMERDSDLRKLRKFSGGDFFRVHHEYLAYDSDLKATNILRLLVVSKNDREAWLYQATFEKKGASWVFEWNQTAELKWAYHEWRVKDALGGEHHHRWIRYVVNRFYHPKQALQIAAPIPKPSDVVCRVPWLDRGEDSR